MPKSKSQPRCFACRRSLLASYWLIADGSIRLCGDCADELAKRNDHAQLIKVAA